MPTPEEKNKLRRTEGGGINESGFESGSLDLDKEALGKEALKLDRKDVEQQIARDEIAAADAGRVLSQTEGEEIASNEDRELEPSPEEEISEEEMKVILNEVLDENTDPSVLMDRVNNTVTKRSSQNS